MIPSMAGMSSKHASKGFFVSVCPASHSYQTIDHYPLVVVGADLVNAFDGSAALILPDRTVGHQKYPANYPIFSTRRVFSSYTILNTHPNGYTTLTFTRDL